MIGLEQHLEFLAMPDAHVCAFGEKGSIPHKDVDIVFVDNQLSYKGKYYPLYKKANIKDNVVAYGRLDEIEKIYNDFNCCGIGELKLRKVVEGEVIWQDNPEEWLPFIKEKGCPVWFHYDMDKSVEGVLDMFYTLPNIFIWCHGGVGYETPTTEIFPTLCQAAEYQAKYPNLYIEISWQCLKYISERPELLNLFDKERLLVGTDNNPILDLPTIKTNLNYLYTLQKYIKPYKICEILQRAYSKKVS